MSGADGGSGYIPMTTVDLSSYPDLVVIYLGMQVVTLRGLKTLNSFVKPLKKIAENKPDGLLHHEFLLMTAVPVHTAFRQYWRDFDSLERFARTGQHAEWWRAYARDTRGTRFWHEAYFMRGGIDAVYANMDAPVMPTKASPATGPRQGIHAFAPVIPATGSMFSSRRRAGREGEHTVDFSLDGAAAGPD